MVFMFVYLFIIADLIAVSADEQVAFKPFEDLSVLMRRPAHLATFIHYLFSNGFEEDSLVRQSCNKLPADKPSGLLRQQ